MDYFKFDPLIFEHPKMTEVGWFSTQVYILLLSVSAKYDLHGRITSGYQDPTWLAARWSVDYGDLEAEPQVAIKNAMARLLDPSAGLFEVDADGSWVILGWSERYEVAQTATQAHFPGMMPGKILNVFTRQDETKRDGGTQEKAEALMTLWNTKAHSNLARVTKLSGQRLPHTRKRLQERSLDEWEKIILKLNTIPWLTGTAKGKESGWRANFDWLIRPGTADKILEGVYDPKGRPQPELRRIESGENLYGSQE